MVWLCFRAGSKKQQQRQRQRRRRQKQNTGARIGTAKPSVRRATRSSEAPALPRRGPGKPARRQLLTDCVPARSPSAPGGPGLTSRPGTSSARLKADVCKCLGCARCQRSSGCSHQGLWRRFAVERLRWESSRSSIKYQVSRTLEWHSGQL